MTAQVHVRVDEGIMGWFSHECAGPVTGTTCHDDPSCKTRRHLWPFRFRDS